MPQRTLSESEFNTIKASVLAALPAGLSEAEFTRVVGPKLASAIGEAESLPAQPEGSAAGRFVSNAAAMLNPIAAAKGIYGAAMHPVQTLEDIGSASMDQLSQAKQAASDGRISETIGHTFGAVPVVGPAAVRAGEQIASGDVAGGLGSAAGLVAPVVATSALRVAGKAKGLIPLTEREMVAQRLEGYAAERVANVMAPKVGANKVRFGNMAEQVAPSLAKMPDGAAWSREGLHAQVGARLEAAEAALDEAANARLGARTFPTQPIIEDLMAKRRRLTSEAVEGSRVSAGATVTGKTTGTGFGPEPPKTVTAGGRGGPIGSDVVPAPNRTRVAEIDRAIGEIKKLGPVARYEPLRRIREAYDGPAKAIYSPSMTADFLKAQGGKMGAADVTGSLRDALVKFDPETAKANAEYSLYRKADDVLTATAEVERTRPKVGRAIMARLTGSVVGQQAAGLPGAAAGFVFGPALDAAVSSGMTTKLQTAKLMSQLASAIRKGDVGHVTSLSYQLKKLGVQAATVQQATSPSGRQSQTTAPGY